MVFLVNIDTVSSGLVGIGGCFVSMTNIEGRS